MKNADGPECNYQQSLMIPPGRRPQFTWIDDRIADEQRLGLHTVGFKTGRWRVFGAGGTEGFIVVIGSDAEVFMVQHESGSGDSMGGDDTYYAARDVAAGIERWSSACLGVDAPFEFFEALRRDAEAAAVRAQEARVEAIRCRDLYAVMCARAKVAEAEAVQRGWSTPYSPSAKVGREDCGQ